MSKIALILTIAVTMIFNNGAGINTSDTATADDISQNTVNTSVSAQENHDNGPALNEYDGLEISAAVLPRKAILPGSVIPVTIIIKNSGDKTISYAQGSGSYETPQALSVSFAGLQPVLPKDYLGISTRDFVTKQLKPGEMLSFVIFVIAIEPNEKLNQYAFDLYNSEKTYIADLEWAKLKKLYPDIAAAKPGSYDGTVSFNYSIVSSSGVSAFGEPTGYAQANIKISITA